MMRGSACVFASIIMAVLAVPADAANFNKCEGFPQHPPFLPPSLCPPQSSVASTAESSITIKFEGGKVTKFSLQELLVDHLNMKYEVVQSSPFDRSSREIHFILPSVFGDKKELKDVVLEMPFPAEFLDEEDDVGNLLNKLFKLNLVVFEGEKNKVVLTSKKTYHARDSAATAVIEGEKVTIRALSVKFRVVRWSMHSMSREGLLCKNHWKDQASALCNTAGRSAYAFSVFERFLAAGAEGKPVRLRGSLELQYHGTFLNRLIEEGVPWLFKLEDVEVTE